MLFNLRMVSIGRFLPKTVVTNDMLADVVDTSDEWITSRTGIKSRHYVDDESTESMAIEAAKLALARAEIARQDISVVIVATSTPDTICPSVACTVSNVLGLSEHVKAFDLNAACSGFVYALDVAKNLLGASGYALVIGSDTVTRMIDFTDRSSCILFGDGAGAVVMAADGRSYNHVAGRVNDTDHALVWRGLPKPSNPFISRVDQASNLLCMDGKEVFRFAVDKVAESIDQVTNSAGVSLEDVDYFVCHQANSRILTAAAKKLDIVQDKFFTNIAHCGNTSSASIPLALDEMIERGLLKRGMKLVLAGFGAGLAYGATYLEY